MISPHSLIITNVTSQPTLTKPPTAIVVASDKLMMLSCFNNSLRLLTPITQADKEKAKIMSLCKNGRSSIMTFYFKTGRIADIWGDVRRVEKGSYESEWYVNIVVILL